MVNLIIGASIVVIAVVVAVPNLISSRLEANEANAIATLRKIQAAQHQFQIASKADEDNDGRGEFGTFGEMGGHVDVRGLAPNKPTELMQSSSQVNAAGEVELSGYVYRMYLPMPGGHAVQERPLGGVPAGVLDPDLAERAWACYAWPTSHGISGRRTFLAAPEHTIVATDDESHSGGHTPHVRAGDGFVTDDRESIVGTIAGGATGADGNVWLRVE